MSAWAKMQQTIDELRAELTSVQTTTTKLEDALAERATSALKYTSANGAVELNCATGELKLGGFSLGSLPSDPQMITVTVGEWTESDLPRNAIERYKFIGDQVMKIPAEHRESAEFSTEDISFDRDGSDIRTALTYRRRETAEEAAERVARQTGSSIVISNKTNGDITVISNGTVVARLRCLKEEMPANAVTQPFVVQGDQVFVPESADHLLNALAANLDPLKFEITEPADQIRQVIRDELKPGGMLHRG